MNFTKLKNRVSYYCRFSFLFIVTTLIIYAPYFILQKTFVWSHDSYTQHLKAMIFISRWYRQTLRALIHFDFAAISTYSFSIGYGSDALSTLAYYGVGDPFYLLSALVPAKYIYLYNENNSQSTTKEEDTQGGVRTISENSNKKEVVYEESNGQRNIVTSSIITPEIKGAVIIAKGANNSSVKSNIIQAVEAATGLPTHKIQVFEMN